MQIINCLFFLLLPSLCISKLVWMCKNYYCTTSTCNDVLALFGYSDRRLRCNGCCPLTSVICDAQQRRQWLVFPFLDVVRPWYTLSSTATTTIYCSCGMIFGSTSWRQTWLNHDSLLRLTLKVPDVQRGYWPVAIHTRSFYGFGSPDLQSAYSGVHTDC